MATIESIQFKRGTKAVLEAKLSGDNKPKRGEPIWELPDNIPEGDTNVYPGKFKIGDGEHNYADLPYFGGTDNLVLEGYKHPTYDAWFKESTYSNHLIRLTNKIYKDIPTGNLYYINKTNDSTGLVMMANAEKAGLVKLFDDLGDAEDGTMTQKSITEAIDTIQFEAVKESASSTTTEVLILKKPTRKSKSKQ